MSYTILRPNNLLVPSGSVHTHMATHVLEAGNAVQQKGSRRVRNPKSVLGSATNPYESLARSLSISQAQFVKCKIRKWCLLTPHPLLS